MSSHNFRRRRGTTFTKFANEIWLSYYVSYRVENYVGVVFLLFCLEMQFKFVEMIINFNE